jgi:hypothetical protein
VNGASRDVNPTPVETTPVETAPAPDLHVHPHEHGTGTPASVTHEHAHAPGAFHGRPVATPVPPEEVAARWVEVEHLHFVYPDGFEALRGVGLRMARGEKVAGGTERHRQARSCPSTGSTCPRTESAHRRHAGRPQERQADARRVVVFRIGDQLFSRRSSRTSPSGRFTWVFPRWERRVGAPGAVGMTGSNDGSPSAVP